MLGVLLSHLLLTSEVHLKCHIYRTFFLCFNLLIIFKVSFSEGGEKKNREWTGFVK